jgi:alkanesulfonate monooxygenase SsuD/methylene tetrahydromethanopterin reductase-like flavin-dependent oxidoreductase (luciferase family)
MGGLLMVGDPDKIAQTLAHLSQAGLRGIGFSFVNYLRELPYFCDEVLPRLERMGIRAKRQHS